MCAVSIMMRLFLTMVWAGAGAFGTWRVRTAMPFRGTATWPQHRGQFQLGLILVVVALGIFVAWIGRIRSRRSGSGPSDGDG